MLAFSFLELFNNTSPSVSVALRRIGATHLKLTAAMRPYSPLFLLCRILYTLQGRHVLSKSGTAEKFTLFEYDPATPHQVSECSLARPHQLKVLRREFILTICPQCVSLLV